MVHPELQTISKVSILINLSLFIEGPQNQNFAFVRFKCSRPKYVSQTKQIKPLGNLTSISVQIEVCLFQ